MDCEFGATPTQNVFVMLRIHCVSTFVASLSTRFESSGGIWMEFALRVDTRVSNADWLSDCGTIIWLFGSPRLFTRAPLINPASAVGVVMRASQFAAVTVPAG